MEAQLIELYQSNGCIGPDAAEHARKQDEQGRNARKPGRRPQILCACAPAPSRFLSKVYSTVEGFSTFTEDAAVRSSALQSRHALEYVHNPLCAYQGACVVSSLSALGSRHPHVSNCVVKDPSRVEMPARSAISAYLRTRPFRKHIVYLGMPHIRALICRPQKHSRGQGSKSGGFFFRNPRSGHRNQANTSRKR